MVPIRVLPCRWVVWPIPNGYRNSASTKYPSSLIFQRSFFFSLRRRLEGDAMYAGAGRPAKIPLLRRPWSYQARESTPTTGTEVDALSGMPSLCVNYCLRWNTLISKEYLRVIHKARRAGFMCGLRLLPTPFCRSTSVAEALLHLVQPFASLLCALKNFHPWDGYFHPWDFHPVEEVQIRCSLPSHLTTLNLRFIPLQLGP